MRMLAPLPTRPIRKAASPINRSIPRPSIRWAPAKAIGLGPSTDQRKRLVNGPAQVLTGLVGGAARPIHCSFPGAVIRRVARASTLHCHRGREDELLTRPA